MYFIYDSLICIRKKLVPSLIIIVSLTICFSAFMKFTCDLLNFEKMTNIVSNMNKSSDFYHLVVTNRIFASPTKQNIDKFSQFSKEMFKSLKVKSTTSFIYYPTRLKVMDINFEGLLVVDKGIDNYHNFQFEAGNYFDNSDFYKSYKDITPVILGSSFIGKVKIGQVLSLGDNLKYKVIGILKKDSTFISNYASESNDSMVVSLDNKAIVPLNKEELANPNSEEGRFFHGLIIHVDNTDSKTLQGKINTIAEKYGFSFYVTNGETLLNNKNHSYETLMYPLVLSALIMIFSFISISFILLTNIYMNKRSIAIKLALGASDFQISLTYIFENLILYIVSINASIFYFKYENKIPKEMLQDTDLTYIGNAVLSKEVMIIFFIIALIMFISNSLLLFINIKNIESNKLMEEIR